MTRLHGVGYPTASVLLHFVSPDLYPIIDYRALWSLGEEAPPRSYSFDFWWWYVDCCRSLAGEAGVTMRTLDRALWQYSKENQPSTRSAARAEGGLRSRPVAQPSSTRAQEVAVSSDFPVDSYIRVVAAAIEQHTIPYSALAGSRRTWGRDLFRIAEYEHVHGRPPLTALVVHKQDGRPGEGFALAMEQVSYAAKPGESADDLWQRASRDVFAYWKP